MPRILIIDDEPAIRRVLRDILENEGYIVEDAASGIEALPIIKEQEFDAIFVTSKCHRWTALKFLKTSNKIPTLRSS